MSPWHWALVIAVGILLFGAKRLPDAARSLGRSARILKAELRGDEPGSATPDPAPPISAGQAQPDRIGPRRNTPPPTT